MRETSAQATTGVRDPVVRSTEDVLGHHLQAFGAGDLSGILQDYASESVIITPDGAVLRGPGQAAPLFEAFVAEFSKPGASFSLGQKVIDGETAYITWSAETADNVYELGTDTFWIHDGKILTQTFAVKATPKR
jgi:ketosteroid isomerase-like protein